MQTAQLSQPSHLSRLVERETTSNHLSQLSRYIPLGISGNGKGDLDKRELIIITDTREQTPLTFKNIPSIRATLKTGDYSIQGYEDNFIVERKSLPDLIGSLTHDRDRFFRELERMHGYTFKRLLVIGRRSDLETGNYRSMATPKGIIASLAVIEIRHGVPVVFSECPEAAARLVETWAHYWAREQALQNRAQGTGDPEGAGLPHPTADALQGTEEGKGDASPRGKQVLSAASRGVPHRLKS